MSPTLKYKNAGVFISTGGSGGPAAYVRPPDWLALPTVTSTDKKVVGLVAVFPHDANFLAVNCAGAYTVDWGDGTAPENIATGVQANHLYDYNDADLAGTECSRGYKQAIVTITPQGSTWTTINLGVKHSQSGLASGSSPWLDVTMAGSAVTALTVRASAATPRLMEQFTWVGSPAVTSTSSMFSGCSSLQSVPLFNTAAVTNMNSMFNGCSSLQSVPLFNTAAVTVMANMFSGCSSLPSVPLFNTVSVTDMGSMFNLCSSLQSVPLFNTAAVISMNSMFSGCSSLQSVPLFTTTTVTGMTNMFFLCSSMRSVPLFNTPVVNTMASMFNGCSALRSVPLFNTVSVADMSSMFNGCSSLQSVPLFNTAAVTNMNNMFNGCSSLQSVPLFNTAAVTAAANIAAMLTGCVSLAAGAMSGTKVSISYSGCRLSSAALDAIYTNLASGVTAQTITVTGNWGTVSDTPSIATAKGWTVTGS